MQMAMGKNLQVLTRQLQYPQREEHGPKTCQSSFLFEKEEKLIEFETINKTRRK